MLLLKNHLVELLVLIGVRCTGAFLSSSSLLCCSQGKSEQAFSAPYWDVPLFFVPHTHLDTYTVPINSSTVAQCFTALRLLVIRWDISSMTRWRRRFQRKLERRNERKGFFLSTLSWVRLPLPFFRQQKRFIFSVIEQSHKNLCSTKQWGFLRCTYVA